MCSIILKDQLRAMVWPYNSLWGDESYAVRNYLIKTWETFNAHRIVSNTLPNAINEENLVLQVS